MDIGASANLEIVDKFCYLADILSVVREPKLIFLLNPIFSDIVFFWVDCGGIGPK